MSTESICIHAYAKINLTLEILNQLPNGYHEIRSVMQQVGLHDEIIINHRSDGKILLHCNTQNVPSDHRNLVWKAVELVRHRAELPYGAEISIVKNIPIAGGLAGGSTDAAATIKGLNELWGLGLTLPEMMSLGEKLGMDVPFCLMGGTALTTGKGHIIAPLPSIPEFAIVIANPGIGVSTREAYEALDEAFTWPRKDHGYSTNLMDALSRNSVSEIFNYLHNDFERTICQKVPMISKIKETMLSYGAPAALLSGSGPSVFCIATSQDQIQEILLALQDLVDFVVVTSTKPNGNLD